jgi:hypothetical protein
VGTFLFERTFTRQEARMRKLKLYAKFVWVCFISLFVPTSTVTGQVEDMLAELKGEPPKPKA